MESVVTVEDGKLHDLAYKMAVITTVLQLLTEEQLTALADIDKEEIVEYGAEIATELLRLRREAIPAQKKDYRH